MTPQAERTTPRREPPPASAPAPKAQPRGARPPLRERLGAWRDQHFYGFFSSLGRLIARPWSTALTVLVIGFAIALPLLAWLAWNNARVVSGNLREAREVTAFLKPAIDAGDAQAFAAELRGRADVAGVVVRTPEQGLAEFRELSGFGDALAALQSNPLPSVLVATPREAHAEADPAIVAVLQADTRVDLVQYDAAWRRKLTGILHLGERIVVVVAVLLGLATLLVIGNTVRMDIQARSAEIAVMQMLGASNGFVRRPFLYAGLWYGLLGALLAVAIVVAVELSLSGPIARLAENYTQQLALHPLAVTSAVAVAAASALLGWVGAWIATARHLAAGRPE